jgi:hypothetical protein
VDSPPSRSSSQFSFSLYFPFKAVASGAKRRRSNDFSEFPLASQASDVGSIPIARSILPVYSPERSFTERFEDIAYTLGPKGLFKGCRVFSSQSI